jgi:hypothetical protein
MPQLKIMGTGSFPWWKSGRERAGSTPSCHGTSAQKWPNLICTAYSVYFWSESGSSVIIVNFSTDRMSDENSIPGCKTFLCFQALQTSCEAHLKTPIQWVPTALTPAVKWPGRETDHPPPSSAETKNGWSCTSSPCGFVKYMWSGFNSSLIRMRP